MRALLITVAVALALPTAASAHASLRSATPGFGVELQHGPGTVRLLFDQQVKVLPGAVRVLNGVGRDFARGSRVQGDQVIANVQPLKLGTYTVRWRAISADSHVVSGVWTFGVGVPAPPVSAAYGAGGPGPFEHFVRWLWFVGLALTIGALGLRLIVLRGLEVPRALDRKLTVAAGAGAVLALQAGIAAFSLRSEDALQLSFGRFLYGDLSPIAQTRFGQAFIVMTLAFALVLALVYLAWLLDRVEPLVPALLIALVFVGGLSASGHDAVDAGSSWKTEIADWVHISAASLWIGGLATMAGLAWFGAPQLRRSMFMRFSQMATVLIALVLGAGAYLGIVRLPHLHDLWTQNYGRVLLVKIGLVGFALLWGAFHKFVIGPALERADEGFLTRIGRSLVGESLVGVSVLLVAAILVDSKPPPRPSGGSQARAPLAQGGDTGGSKLQIGP
jgi:copper transport protein